MIEKDKGSPKLHRLRVIQLLEADLNFCLGLVFRKRMMGFATKHCGLNESQYGSKGGHLCHSAILNKVLTYDILRLKKDTAAMAEFDAIANYDRMIPVLVAMACRRLGLGKAAGNMLLDTLKNTKHRISTGFGDSEETHSSTKDHKVFGTGQGSGGSPHFWLAVSEVMFKCIDRDMKGIELTNPDGTLTSDRTP